MNRRRILLGLITLSALPAHSLSAQLVRRARQRERVHRRVRRRIRRRAVARVVRGRPVWVVPARLAVGWELLDGNRVLIVRQTRYVAREGLNIEVAVMEDANGKTQEVEILRQDTLENSEELEGSELPANDRSTPGVEVEIAGIIDD